MSKELFKRIISSIVLLPIALLTIVEGSVYFIAVILLCLFVSIYEWLKMKILNFLKLLELFFTFFIYTIYKFGQINRLLACELFQFVLQQI